MMRLISPNGSTVVVADGKAARLVADGYQRETPAPKPAPRKK